MDNEKIKQTSIYLNKGEIRDLKKVAADHGTSLTKLVRKQVQKLIEEEDRKKGKSRTRKPNYGKSNNSKT